jgi:hypothetical protein
MKQFTTIEDCQIIEFGKINNRSGSITVVEKGFPVTFDVKRIFYLYDIPAGENRGAHAHKRCHQIVVAASGSFEIELDDSLSKKRVLLNRPFLGLHILPGIWAHELNFSSGAICLVLTSELYDANDYIRDYNQYMNLKSYELV